MTKTNATLIFDLMAWTALMVLAPPLIALIALIDVQSGACAWRGVERCVDVRRSEFDASVRIEFAGGDV